MLTKHDIVADPRGYVRFLWANAEVADTIGGGTTAERYRATADVLENLAALYYHDETMMPRTDAESCKTP